MSRQPSELISIKREQILAFRLHSHNLSQRLPAEALDDAVGASGLRNSPPGSAELSLHARLDAFASSQLDKALSEDKTLLEAWSIRSSPFIFPTNQLACFMLGTFPTDEAGLQFYLQSALPTYKRAEISMTEALERVVEAMLSVLDGQSLPKGEFSRLVSEALPEKLLYWCAGCQAKHVPESFFRGAAQKALICIVSQKSGTILFGRSEQWLDTAWLEIEPMEARKELLRRYLHCYAPSNYKDFAKWAGISPEQAQQQWQLIENELQEVSFEGKTAWLLRQDLAQLTATPPPPAARLLPPYDSYLLLSDRTTLLPDTNLHKEVWRALGNPGIVLAEGEAVGMWRPQKKGKRLLLNVTLFGAIPNQSRTAIEAEAELLAPVKGCTLVEVNYTLQ